MLKEGLFLLVLFLTNIVQGITGFAGTVLAMPPSILLEGIDVAKPILNIMGLLVAVWIVIISYKSLNVKEFLKIMIIMFLGLVLGNYIYSVLPVPMLLKFYAIFIIGIALKGLLVKTEKDLPEFFLVMIVFVAGIIHGMFVSGGPLLIIYAAKKFKEKTEFRATVSCVWLILNSYLGYSHYAIGLFTPETVTKLMWGIPPVIIGAIIGNILHKKMSQKLFLLITYILLIISGVTLLF
ncbi:MULTISPECIES: sulfite exporter TauE/SafE family protein [Fusobacterium]|uniref:sulfite exporter TauE/SafE family protein n=1 Tax=Fusobacterium TaxID=848 RepID=UPI001476EC8D|nr:MULTISPECIES: sulfite exporter TauE/SafE family protein [Fusobacterium]NME36766.1 sulfite exporter TauE/SafE family protein [Fusobacterium sp. FSA-380-WT-3A]